MGETEFSGGWSPGQCGGGPCCSSLPPCSAASPRSRERGGKAGLVLAVGMEGCWAPPAGPLCSRRPLLPPPWRLYVLRLSPTRLQVLQDSLLGWLEAGMLGSSCPCPHPQGTDISPLQAHFPSHPLPSLPKLGDGPYPQDVSGSGLASFWQSLSPLIRGRGLEGPSCAWHLHTWRCPGPQRLGSWG